MLDKYIPVPITLPVTPLGSSAIIPPRIVSAVTAVSALKGVGSGRTRPSPLEEIVALTSVDSWSSTRIV